MGLVLRNTGRQGNREPEIQHGITWEGNVLADGAGTNRARIRVHSVQNVDAGRVRMNRGPHDLVGQCPSPALALPLAGATEAPGP
jgi:hypothetical protein